MSFLSRAFSGGHESRDLTSTSWWPWLGGGIPTPAEDAALQYGGVVDGQYGALGGHQAMRLSAFNACVTLLADTVASLSVTAYRMQGSVQVPVDPQPKLFLDSPYPELTWFDWLWMLMESLTVTGNGISYVTAVGADDRPIGLMPIHPSCVQVEWPTDRTDWVDPVYRIYGQLIPNDRIVHIKRYPIPGAVLGLSPVEKAAAAVGLGLSAERYGLNYFRDSANPSSVLESDLPLDDDQTKRLQKQWIGSHGGRRRPAILSGGVKWRPIAISPNESQFLETRKYQRGEIAMLFRIPPFMIGDTEKSTSWGTGLEQQSIGFATYTLRPWLTCIEQALSRLLPRGVFVKFNIDGLLRGDVKTRWEAYQLGRDSGVYSVNDIRMKEDEPPIGPEGDIRLQPMNFAPLGYEPPEPTPPTQPADPAAPDEPPADQQGPAQEDNNT